jgi:hypothetical protein
VGFFEAVVVDNLDLGRLDQPSAIFTGHPAAAAVHARPLKTFKTKSSPMV